jgi:iron(III) transport system substrate-binding protein
MLQPVSSETLTRIIPAHLRHPQGLWFGMTYRARPIMYVKDKVDPAQLSTYEDLADPRWRGELCVRSSNSIYNQSMLASMIATVGAEQAQRWATGLVANFARRPQGGDRDQVMAAASGQCDLVLANTYYLAQMLTADNAAQQEAATKVAVFWPNQKDRGTHINISGAALTKAAKNRDNAVRLLEYMVSEQAQQWYAEVNQEYPVRAGVPASELLQSWGTFKADSVNLTELGINNPEAVRVMDKAGWR